MNCKIMCFKNIHIYIYIYIFFFGLKFVLLFESNKLFLHKFTCTSYITPVCEFENNIIFLKKYIKPKKIMIEDI